ncbi:MAG: hypothetical protein LC643_05125, partial [Bacteroidales bacterium]|nr:hypothetical protein [Bacteroidales bacterium]
MKKNLYRIGLSNRLNGQWSRISMKLLGLVVASFLMAANTLMAQTTPPPPKWTGAESSSFTLDNNWDPAGAIDNKSLVIPLRADYTNVPELTGSTSYTVTNIEVTWDADTALVGKYIVSLDPEASLTLAAGSNIDYETTGIIVNSGNVYYQGYLRFDKVGTFMIVNGGYVELSRYLIMNNNGDTNTGGQVIVNGGTVRLNGGFHGRVSKNLNQWIITGDGKLEVSGNYGSVAEDIESGWISGGDDYSIVRTYDA